MSTKDFIKKSVLNAFTQYDAPKLAVALLAALALGILIYLVYRKFYTGVVYSRSFAVTLVGMCVLTCMVTLAISTNVVISLGMVGALSIVRFRTAVKDPLDTAYMFWALPMGILLGAGQFLLTAVAGVAIAVLITLVCKWRVKNQNCYLLVLRMNEAAEKPAAQVVNGIRFQRLRTKTVMQGAIEATYEVRLDKTEPVLKRLHDIPGMQDATLVAYTGEGA